MFGCVLKSLLTLGRCLPRRTILGTQVWGQGDEGPPGSVFSPAIGAYADSQPGIVVCGRQHSDIHVSLHPVFSVVDNFLIFAFLQFFYNHPRPNEVRLSIRASKDYELSRLVVRVCRQSARYSSYVSRALQSVQGARVACQQLMPSLVKMRIEFRPLVLITET